MDTTVTPNTSVSATAAQSAFAEAATSGKTSALSSDFETFLRMLTVQMENQDPLNPVDSADYAVQLATFSSVEQQVLTNDLLRDLGATMGVSGLSQVANWVGQQARVTAPVQYDGTPLSVVTEPVSYADTADLVISTADGTELQRVPIDVRAAEVEWTPIAGTYAASVPVVFTVESFSGGASLGTTPSAVYAPVREVRMENGLPVIVVPGGNTVASTSVTALRQAPVPAQSV